MVKKEYRIVGTTSEDMVKFDNNLHQELIRFIHTTNNITSKLEIFISPDMVSEVEELIMEIAKKSGVKVE